MLKAQFILKAIFLLILQFILLFTINMAHLSQLDSKEKQYKKGCLNNKTIYKKTHSISYIYLQMDTFSIQLNTNLAFQE